jgi:hypothetical protein
MAFMAAALPLLSAASAAIGVIGTLSQASAASASARSEADAARWNAENDRQRATTSLQQANAQEELQRRNARKSAGNLRAGLVENGIALEGGTGADLVEESSLNAEMDALNIRYQGQLNAKGYNESANQNMYAASAADARAKNAKTAGYLGAAGQVLSGVGGYVQGQQANRLATAQTKYYGG